MRREPITLVAGLAIWLAAPWAVGAVSVTGWSLTASPMTVTAGVVTDISQRLTDTDGSGDIGCMRMSVPAAFAVLSVSVTATSAQTPWAATRLGAGPTAIEVYNPDGNGKLKGGDWVDFRVTVRGQQVGTFSWVADVVQGNDCTGSTFLTPISLSMTVAAPSATPAPTPSATPTPPPTPTPTPSATPTPTPLPSATANLQPTAMPSSTPSATDHGGSHDPVIVLPGGTPQAGDNSGTGAGSSASAGTVTGADGSDATIAQAFGALGLLGESYSWFVPGLVVGVPGLLLVLLVALHVGLGAAWVPNVGRLLGPAPPDPPTDEHLWWATGGPITQ